MAHWLVPFLGALSLGATPPRSAPDRAAAAVALRVLPSAPVPAPRMTLVGLDGARTQVVPRKGEVLLVTFWATWCSVCRSELPGLLVLGRELQARYPGRFRIIGVSMDEDEAPVQGYLEELGRRVAQPRWTVALDTSDQATLATFYSTARAAGIPDDYVLPQTYVIDRSGNLIGYLEGPRDWTSSAARAYFEALLR